MIQSVRFLEVDDRVWFWIAGGSWVADYWFRTFGSCGNCRWGHPFFHA